MKKKKKILLSLRDDSIQIVYGVKKEILKKLEEEGIYKSNISNDSAINFIIKKYEENRRNK